MNPEYPGISCFPRRKTDAAGDTLWTRQYSGQPVEECRAMQQTTHGGFILGGGTSCDLRLLRADAQGDSLWSQTCGGTGIDVCCSVWPMRDGGYAVAGKTASFGAGSTEAWLIVTEPDPAASIDEAFPSPSPRRSVSVHPNPFNPHTTLTFELLQASRTEVRIIDLAGRLIRTAGRVYRPAGAHSIGFEAHDLVSGVYICRLEAGEFFRSGKMLLMK